MTLVGVVTVAVTEANKVRPKLGGIFKASKCKGDQPVLSFHGSPFRPHTVPCQSKGWALRRAHT